mgnify:CR=1 FL=1|jgi:hypothetical protein
MIKTYQPKVRPTLEEAQAMVGGWVVMALNKPNMQVLVDEDGLSKELEFNRQASELCNDFIVGNAIVLEGDAMWIDDEEDV